MFFYVSVKLWAATLEISWNVSPNVKISKILDKSIVSYSVQTDKVCTESFVI